MHSLGKLRAHSWGIYNSEQSELIPRMIRVSPADKWHILVNLDLGYIENVLTDFNSPGPLLKETS